MKTFAHTNAVGDILGIGMIYFEDGSLTPEVAALVAQHGEDAGLIAYGEKVKPHIIVDDVDMGPDPALSVVIIDTTEMPGGSVVGYDKTFRNAFKHGTGRRVDVDIPKAKGITHDKRRIARGAELAPLDIQSTIPSQAVQAEAARQAIRDKYAAMQVEIDACTTAEALLTIINREGL